VRNVFAPVLSEWIRASHPLRLQYEIFDNPLMASLQSMARWARTHRQQVEPDNPILAAQEAASEGIVNALDAYRDFRDALAERIFLAVYGSPLLQASLGIDPFGERPPRKAGRSTLHRQFVETRIAELKSRIRVGGLRESVVRAMLYVGIPRGAVDERGFEAIRRLRTVTDGGPHMTLSEFKAMVREQFFMLLLDEDAAIAAIPALLPQDADSRRTGFALLRSVLSTSGDITGESATRLQRIAQLMGVDAATTSPGVAA
jgi:hypothetical protein